MLKKLLRLKNVSAYVCNYKTLQQNAHRMDCRAFATKERHNAEEDEPVAVQPANKANPFARGTTKKTANNLSQETTVNPLETNEPKSLNDLSQQSSVKEVNPFARATTQSLNNNEEESLVELDDPETEKRLKVLKLEADIAHQEGRRVPELSFFKDHHWQHILPLPSKSARFRYYAYLYQIELKRQSMERKKTERKEFISNRREQLQQENEENNHIIYGLSHTSMFLRIYDSTINHWQNNKLTRAMQFAPKVVLDCSYDEYMTKMEANYAAKQLMLCFAENRAHDDPFDLHYCNVDFKTTSIQGLKRYIPTMLNPEFPMNVHEQCFTKIFPKEQLVYLTPHCRNELQSYNADDVYIVGAMVDKAKSEPLSLAKAKRLGLRMARLPLDNYLQWAASSGKSLTLNQMINILLDLKSTGDWEKALRHVPRRKLLDMSVADVQQKKALQRATAKYGTNVATIFKSLESLNTSRTVRSNKEDLQFDMKTWASDKSKKSQ